MVPGKENTIKQEIDHLFRHEYGKIVAHLTGVFGTGKMEMIEDSVQDALMKAMQVWPYKNLPEDPSSWILKVARNKMIDKLRRQNNFRNKYEATRITLATSGEFYELPVEPSDNELNDDLLKMIFACCSTGMSQEQQVIITLKILCGFGTAEIARALFKKKGAVLKACTRAKNQLGKLRKKPELPAGKKLESHLQSVLYVLYLMFNEGYNATRGERLIRYNLCGEAIRLNHILIGNKRCDSPDSRALLALMYFHASRFQARTSPEVSMLTLEEQDRNKWDRALIKKGFENLNRSAYGTRLSKYHIEAGIAATHCMASDLESTDWPLILQLYDLLLQVDPSPAVMLNRVVAIAQVKGEDAALKELQKEELTKLEEYYLYQTIKAELLVRTGKIESGKDLLKKAIRCTNNKAEQNFIRQKLEKT